MKGAPSEEERTARYFPSGEGRNSLTLIPQKLFVPMRLLSTPDDVLVVTSHHSPVFGHG